MEEVAACRACNAECWRVLERVTFRREPPAPPADAGTARWEELRRDFFFGTWAPAGLRELELTVQLCESCGLVVYSPRPSEQDVEQKYERLRQLGIGPGASADSERGRALDRQRSDRLLTLVSEPGGRASMVPSVLDVGGGDGKLMRSFVDAGWAAYVVDYNTEPVAGVTRLGDTLADIPPGTRFDVLVCAHVLEHVVDPLALARDMAALLAPGGRLYAEVPLEIWRGTPIEDDPLTHLSYFTGVSLTRLLEASGLSVRVACERWGTYGENVLEVAHAVAVASDGGRGVKRRDPVQAVTRRLRPAPYRRARRRLAVRRALRAAARV